MRIAHLLASPFFGGPERQILGLALAMRKSHESFFLTFAEQGKAMPFLDHVCAAGFDGVELCENWPHYFRSADEIASELKSRQADILCTSGYKPDIIGLRAARLAVIPVVAIAHGWTGATWRVRLNEFMDRRQMRKFDAVVGVSQAQSDKLLQSGIHPDKVVTIPNAIGIRELNAVNELARNALEALFSKKPRLIVVAAGRLSPEKGFDNLIAAAASISSKTQGVGFVIFGEGPLRTQLTELIARNNLDEHFVLPGFSSDLEQLLPSADVFVIPSRTEGLPVVLLEAMSAGLPTVATVVGGIPEVIEDGVDGFLVPPNDVEQLSRMILELLGNAILRTQFREAGPRKIAKDFNTTLQAERYSALFNRLVRSS